MLAHSDFTLAGYFQDQAVPCETSIFEKWQRCSASELLPNELLSWALCIHPW
jgi:hypothetical protein